MGMLVDLSHVSKDTMLDVLGARPEKGRGSVAPVIFSHSSAYSLCPHPRNVQNDILELVKKTKSIVVSAFRILPLLWHYPVESCDCFRRKPPRDTSESSKSHSKEATLTPRI